MIYPMVSFPVTLVTLDLDFKVMRNQTYRCPRRIVCAADARSVCDSYVLVSQTIVYPSVTHASCSFINITVDGVPLQRSF